MEAGASDSLPTSVLLGTDVPETGLLLQGCRQNIGGMEGQSRADKALVVETRAQAQQRERKEAVEKVKEMTSSVRPSAVGIEDLGHEGVDKLKETDFNFDG